MSSASVGSNRVSRPATRAPLTAQSLAQLLGLQGEVRTPELFAKVHELCRRPAEAAAEEVAEEPFIFTRPRTPEPQHEPLRTYSLREFAPEGTHHGRINKDMQLPSHRGVGGKYIEDFLTALREYGVSCGFSESDFMTSVDPTALRGEAKMWWDFKRGFQRWDQFKAAFSTRFLPEDYRDTLLRELNLRTQGDEETLTTFIYAITAYFRRILPGATDAEIISKVRNQAHPRYKTLLAGTRFYTLADLEEAAPGLDATLLALNRYVAPPPASELLDPAVGYNPPRKAASVQDRNRQQKSDRSRGRDRSQRRDRDRSQGRSQGQNRPQQHQDRRPSNQQQPAARGSSRPPYVRHNNGRPNSQQVQVTGGNAEPIKTTAAAPSTGSTTAPAATGAIPKVAAEPRRFNCYYCGEEGHYANVCPKRVPKN